MAENRSTSTQSPARRQESGEPLQTSGRGVQGRHHLSSPFQLMRRMTEEMDRTFERLFDDLGFGGRSGLSSARAGMWAPRIEAFQKEDQFIVRAELPGLKKDDVEVNVTEDAITIQGQRQEEHERKQEGFYHSERSYGTFYRAIPLPQGVISDSAKASFKDGVLEIRLQAPPNEVSSGRRVEITDESTQRNA